MTTGLFWVPDFVHAPVPRYQGPNASKYMVEGKYHIPEGYKSIVKWDEDEVVFMTRRGVFGPEYHLARKTDALDLARVKYFPEH